MFVIIATAFIILHITLAKDIVNSTNDKKSFRHDNDILKELLERLDQLEKNVNIRLDRLEANFQDIEANNKKTMETIVEQQMVITAEIFTISHTLPLCCSDSGKNDSTTTDPAQMETTTTTTTKPTPSKTSSCAEAIGGSGQSGVYKIHVTNSGLDPFDAYCMKSVDNKETDGTWLLIQRRQDNYTDFYQGWNKFKLGFGDLNKSFWIGLDKIYALTTSTEHELWVQLELNNGIKFWALYSNFAIGSETEKYALKTIGDFRSINSKGDCLTYYKGTKWSTYDNDNDETNYNCAAVHKGAWWHKVGVGLGHLNGIYGNGMHYLSEIRWHPYPPNMKHNYITYVHMAIRPRQ